MAKRGASDTKPREDGGDVEALEALFAAVLDEARANPTFARRLVTALGELGSSGLAAGTSTRRTDWRAEAPVLDPSALFRAEGADGLRRALRALTRRQVYALVRVHELDAAGASALTKAQLIEHAVRALTRTATPRKRVFDY